MSKSLLEDLEESLAEEMHQAMDFEVLCELFIPFGWTVIKTEHQGGQEWIDCVDWARANCSGDYRENNGKWLFESSADATAFVLRWA